MTSHDARLRAAERAAVLDPSAQGSLAVARARAGARWHAAVGADSLVWGLGETEAEALEDGRAWLGVGDAHLEVREVSLETMQRISAGVVSCEALGLDPARRRS